MHSLARALRSFRWLVLAAALAAPGLPRLTAAPALDLAGTWRFALDREDAGIAAQWFRHDLADHIAIPGALQAQGYGDEISTSTPWVVSLYDRHWDLRAPYQAYTKPGAVKVPFLSQPPRHYLGAAWYQRDVDIPPERAGQRGLLFLERARWKTTVWLDAREIGSQDSLVAPHEFDLGELTAGRHRLTLRVDNREIVPGYRPDAHAVSDFLGSTWNGIVGRVELRTTPPVWLDDVQVFPDVAARRARIVVAIGNHSGRPGSGTLRAGDTSGTATWTAAGGRAEVTVQFPGVTALWSEFNPVLQHLTVRLEGADFADAREVSFGFREIRAQGSDFLVNGQPVNMRGTHFGGDFPLTGYPATDVDYWRKLFRTCREWGLNHMRFHSWCPPEAAFVAADEIGFYLQPECGMWNAINPDSVMERRTYEETERMIRAYGNHPSFALFSPSNEPAGNWKVSLTRWVEHYRAADPRRLYTPGTGWPLIDDPGHVEGADFLATMRIGRRPLRNTAGWFGKDYDSSLTGTDVPVVAHEVGQWCAYPDFSVMAKFTGYLQPGNYAIARDWAERKGLLERNAVFARASGKFQLAAYKEDIEASLRTRGLRGFQLLDLHDYLGQGTALVGVLDAFWEEKGYVTAAEWRRFCAPTVPLARLPQRVFTSAETFVAPVELVHFGAAPLAGALPQWRVVDAAGATVAEGAWAPRDVPLGAGHELGEVRLDLGRLAAPAEYRLVVELRGTAIANDWNFWVYPAADRDPAPPGRVRLTHHWPEAEKLLAAGERVLFVPRPADLAWTCPPLARTPVFWNRLMGPNWDRMLGLAVAADHPALAQFPTEDFGDWQWIDLVGDTRAINLDALPRALQPIVQPVDDWNRNYKLGLLFEAAVGPGRLMVCAVDLDTNLEQRPGARQLRRSLLAYLNSPAFQPAVAVEPAALRSFLFDTHVMAHLGAAVEGPGNVAALIDGDPNRFWQAGGFGRGGRGRGGETDAPRPQHPYDVVVTFPQAEPFSGVVLMPRQNERNHAGDVREYELAVGDDGAAWTTVARGELASSFDPHVVNFGRTVTARKLRFTARSGFGEDRTAAMAELAVIYEGEATVDDSGEVHYQRATSATPEIEEGAPPPAGR